MHRCSRCCAAHDARASSSLCLRKSSVASNHHCLRHHAHNRLVLQHGVYRVDYETDKVSDLLYRASAEAITQTASVDGKVALVGVGGENHSALI